MELVSNKCTVTRKIEKNHHRASTHAQNCYWALSVQRYRRTTTPQSAHDLAYVSGRRISRQTVSRRLAEACFMSSF
ncbi:hypothetical protein TNCV_1380391 [Trichonephila clavipes]|nr:hypothetical protein TNCV_1380391 [Trichonephila clavipes]